MAPIYSANLGHINVADNGVFHTIYGPVGPGPAVVRGASFFAAPGARPEIFANDPGGTQYGLAQFDNAGGAYGKISSVALHQVLPPGWTITAYNDGAMLGLWMVIVGGYQFSS